MDTEIFWIVTTIDSKEGARKLSEGAVPAGLAACAQIEGPIQSIYLWEGELKQEAEWRITFKAAAAKAKSLIEWIQARHPYDVPEILAWPISMGNPAYLRWVNE